MRQRVPHGDAGRDRCAPRSVSPSTSSSTSAGCPPMSLKAVNCADVRMIERREHARFALEPGETVRIRRKGGRQHLDRHIAAQRRIARPVHLAHPAFANSRRNHVRSQTLTDERRSSRRSRPLRGTQERRAAVMREQRLDLAAERGVTPADLRQKRVALARLALEYLVIHTLDRRPPLRCHASSHPPTPAPATIWPTANHA